MPTPNRSATVRTNRRTVILDSVRTYKRTIVRNLSATGRVVWTLSDLLIMLDDCEDKAVILLGNALLRDDGNRPRSTKQDVTKDRSEISRNQQRPDMDRPRKGDG